MGFEKIQKLLGAQDFIGAKKLLKEILSKREDRELVFILGVVEAKLGAIEEAIGLLSRVIEIDPNHAGAHYTKANLLTVSGRHGQAMQHHDLAAKLLPANPWSFINRGISRAALKSFEGAIDDFDRAIDLDPAQSVAYQNKGNLLMELGRLEDSFKNLDKAIALDPGNFEALSNKSSCLMGMRLPESALITAEQSIKINPNHAEGWNNRGIALSYLRRYAEALDSYEQSIQLKPEYAAAWSNRGVTLNDLGRHEEAVTCCERSVSIMPEYAEGWNNLGLSLAELQRYDEALAAFERAFAIKPELDFLLESLLHTQMKICEWGNLDQRAQLVRDQIAFGAKAKNPFPLLGLFDSLELHRDASRRYSEKRFGVRGRIVSDVPWQKLEKIRVGYFSGDFYDHATMYLMAELFEIHRRDEFEFYGFSFTPNTSDEMARRARVAMDHFFDVSHMADSDVVRLSREHGIDIAVDLKGYTKSNRSSIFAQRAAPIQINYLGYPGTMGASYIDYLIGDPVVVPEGSRDFFGEKIIYLPDSYQANCSSKEMSGRIFGRQDAGLPQCGFVFCCFNNNWKVTPDVFGRWMRLLRSVDGSVLWLFEDNPIAAKNLRLAAAREGVDPVRLVFAKHMGQRDHLARYKLADLFLDTFPYNAHTTASDALWAGVPLLTMQGTTFASRVAASLLRNIGLPELVTETAVAYEALAIELATDPQRLAALKARLEDNRLTSPLFDTNRFARHIEAAYRAAYDRYHAGLAPDHITVAPI